MLSELVWSLWRCFPVSLRLAVYRWLERHGDASRGHRIRMCSFGLVIKTALGSPHYEADNMRFVAKNTSIPVPRVLDVIEYVEDSPFGPPEPTGVIVMNRLPGDDLERWISHRAIRSPRTDELLMKMNDCMVRNDFAGFNETIRELDNTPPPTLDMTDADLLVRDLRNAFAELRALPPPSRPVVAGLAGRPIKCNRAGDCTLLGPFDDQQEFKDAVFAQANPFLFPHRMPALRRLAEPVNAKKHRICFTHADLAARNILVKDGILAGILDWEYSGWYPEYWELTTMEAQMIRRPLEHQFWDAVQLFGPEPYRNELTLEWVLWQSTGTTLIVGEEGDDYSCPRVKQPLVASSHAMPSPPDSVSA